MDIPDFHTTEHPGLSPPVGAPEIVEIHLTQPRKLVVPATLLTRSGVTLDCTFDQLFDRLGVKPPPI